MAAQKQREQDKARQMEIKSEQTVQGLSAQINKIDDLMRKKEADAEQLESRVKELIAQNKKTEAKKEVGTLKTIRNELTVLMVLIADLPNSTGSSGQAEEQSRGRSNRHQYGPCYG